LDRVHHRVSFLRAFNAYMTFINKDKAIL